MITIRPAGERGHADHGWLSSHHTFSFASYIDPEQMGFRSLRVVNDDTVQPAKGFGKHSHDNMEIISFVIDGALAHEDSMGNVSVLRPGDVQCMTAGRGITHSEFNHSKKKPLRFLQVWILPSQHDLTPNYAELRYESDERRNRLRLLVSTDRRDNSLSIHQDAEIYGCLLEKGERVEQKIRAGRHAWLQVARGSVRVNDVELGVGDGAAISEERCVVIEGLKAAEFLLFDLE